MTTDQHDEGGARFVRVAPEVLEDWMPLEAAVYQAAVTRRAEREERACRQLVRDSLPRGMKWAVDRPLLLRVAKRLRLWKPPTRVVYRYH